MECRATCRCGTEDAGREVKVRLEEENLFILPGGGGARTVPYREIISIAEGDYRVALGLASGEEIALSALGYHYEDFLLKLFKLRGEVILKEMLMQEAVFKAGLAGEYRLYGKDGRERQQGRCEPRLYQTALVVIPQKDDPLRIPFSEIEAVREEDYALAVHREEGERIVFSMMGTHLDPFKKALAGAMNELQLKTQALLKEMLPAADEASIRRLARLMPEGRAAARGEVEKIAPELWAELEKKVKSSAVNEEYAYLAALARRDQVCLGIKRGLMGELTGEYTWFLLPIYDRDPGRPGNALAMESFTGEDTGGGASYFFRIMSRAEYARGPGEEYLRAAAERFVKEINRSMTAVNFRREPVYLSAEQLKEPQYLKYLYATARLPELRRLREHFIGRVIHSSFEQWRRDVDDLLKFNVGTTDDRARWDRGQS